MPADESLAQPVIVVMAKQPVVGKTKTRLSPPLEPSEATALYEAMLRDTIDLVAGLPGIQLAIAITPRDAVDAFRSITPPETALLPVCGTDIGDCLHQILCGLLADGFSKAIAIDSDSPTLPAAHLIEAVELLDHADVVVGPSEDGGYYLIGLKQPQPGLFRDIAWSTKDVTSQTVARAEVLGLSVALLDAWYDVDVAADLARLRRELEALPEQTLPHTRRALRNITSQ